MLCYGQSSPFCLSLMCSSFSSQSQPADLVTQVGLTVRHWESSSLFHRLSTEENHITQIHRAESDFLEEDVS